MVAIDLDESYLDRLHALAKSQGQQPTELARRIVLDFLDLESLSAVSDDDWAEASMRLTPEVFGAESWDDDADGP
jgi:hypothetical protein